MRPADVYETYLAGFSGDIRVFGGDVAVGAFFPAAVGAKYRGLFCFWTAGFVVAGGDIHGGDYVCRGYAAGGHGTGVHAGDFGELVVVEFSAIGNDDRVPVRAIVEAVGAADRRGVCGDALRGEAGGISAGIPRCVSGAADELPDPGLGDQGDDQHRRRDAGIERCEESGAVRFIFDAVYGALRFAGWAVGRVVDGCVPVCVENGDRDCGGVVWSAGGGRNAFVIGDAGSAARGRRPGSGRYHGIAAGFFARDIRVGIVDASGDDLCGAVVRAVVGVLVSGCGAGGRRIHCAADFQRAG